MAGFDAARALAGYDPGKLTIATVCSHSSLQIFHGARQEGFRTLGICKGKAPRYYDAFPLGKPDAFFPIHDYAELADHADELRARNVILIPHGSFVEYLGAQRYVSLQVPVYGNRGVLDWESDRVKSRQWLLSARVQMPEVIEDPKDINRPCIVKYMGAKGGRGFFIARNYEEFKQRIDPMKPYHIQEFVLGTRYYIHYFYSPLTDDGYTLPSGGSLQLLGVDRRDESIIDEAHRLGSIYELEEMGIHPTFVVTGNFPLVMRESLLPEALDMGARVVERAKELFGGLWGPFCLETVITDQLQFKVFEVSARIVAGTNPYISGSPYSDLVEPGMSTGRRMAKEIAYAVKLEALPRICT
ncbi:MAG TPA: formate--phosphoribosylaminoimidazolecarboxamide ligase [Candidatus Thermoplasmatota archaeon]|jgi:5-formaminoimidazole-4-carboxamide-1-(beta)-D-ribofuranosyl 5'-monophosphate synthetase|nr:formate--phosphoribosylaminoimidazolecarboxamide ligase [Candidatus Thermoplasmatota archaeon]